MMEHTHVTNITINANNDIGIKKSDFKLSIEKMIPKGTYNFCTILQFYEVLFAFTRW